MVVGAKSADLHVAGYGGVGDEALSLWERMLPTHTTKESGLGKTWSRT